jgi:chemosensory pili system protein ChpC
MNGAGAEIYCLLVPLADGRLLIPRTCVAEVVGYQVPAEMGGAPPWYLGIVGWSGRQLPLVSFEGLCGQPIVPASSRTRIVLLHALGSRLEVGAFGLVSQGFPQLLRINADVIRPDLLPGPMERWPVLCRARMLNDTPLIPDFERIESLIAEETSVLAN